MKNPQCQVVISDKTKTLVGLVIFNFEKWRRQIDEHVSWNYTLEYY